MQNESITADLLRQIVAEAIREATTTLPRLSFTEPEAAAMLGVRSHVLRDARIRGEIRATKVGGRISYRRQDLDEYLQRQLA